MNLVTYHGVVYEARDFETGEAYPEPNRAVWIEQTDDDLMDIARGLDMLFANPNEFASFKYMIRQGSTRIKEALPYVMVKHNDGLAYLTDHGLIEVEKEGFTPNFINHRIISKDEEEYAEVKQLFRVITEWTGDADQAHSLLYHLSTALQPGWAAVKYLLLLGVGRNGKGLLLAMFRKLLGKGNVSGVLRQDIAARRAIIATLNNRLANIVFDGPMSYIAESGPEKTLTAGEPLDIELKFENQPFTVQTNALFIEALQKEPKARDKSSALQKRLVRFHFPNVYEKDLMFEHVMTSDRMMDAFLTLLWEHWVDELSISSKLKLTEGSQDLQINNDLERSPILAFIEATNRTTPGFIEEIKGGKYPADTFVAALQPWLASQNYGDRTVTAIWEQLADHFVIERKTKREGGKPITRKVLGRILPDTWRALNTLEGGSSDDEAVVRDD
jgi:hypothetical protein